MEKRRRPSWRSVTTLVLSGVAFGALTSACDHGLGPARAAKLLGNDWGWLVAGLAACWSGRSWKGAFGRGLEFLIPAVLSYYGSDSMAGVYDTSDVDNPTAPPEFFLPGVLIDSGVYIVLGTMTAAVLALILTRTRRGGVSGILCSIVVPGYITWNAWHTHALLSNDPGPSYDPVLLQVTGLLWPAALAVTVGVFLMSCRRLQHTQRSLPRRRMSMDRIMWFLSRTAARFRRLSGTVEPPPAEQDWAVGLQPGMVSEEGFAPRIEFSSEFPARRDRPRHDD